MSRNVAILNNLLSERGSQISDGVCSVKMADYETHKLRRLGDSSSLMGPRV
jgi:hypothetical protein